MIYYASKSKVERNHLTNYVRATLINSGLTEINSSTIIISGLLEINSSTIIISGLPDPPKEGEKN